MGENNSFVFYESFYEAIQYLPEAEQLKAYKMIAEYSLRGVEPTESCLAMVVFSMAKPQIDANKTRRENASKGGRPKKEIEEEKPMVSENEETKKPMVSGKQKTAKPLDTESFENEKPNVNVNVNVNDNVNVLKEKEYTSYIPKRKDDKFVPPTVDDVSKYAKEKGYAGFNADNFVAFYASKGWMVGKNKMKDWKSAVTGWHTREKDKPPAQQKIIPAPQRYVSEDRDLDFLVR